MTDVTTQQSAQIVQFGAGRVGQTVGDGECFALAELALRSAGARSAANYGAVTPGANYVWGRAVTIGQLRAGDVIQFRNYSVTVTTVTKITQPDGSWTQNTETQTMTRPHHTAIASDVGRNGDVVLYEQNVNDARSAMATRLYFTSRREPAQTTTEDGVTTTVTRTIQVTGTVRFYRPQTP